MFGWAEALFRWLTARRDRREHPRFPSPLVAYYWTGGAPQPYSIRDISETGAFILSEEKWCVGTMLRVTLQEFDHPVTQEALAALHAVVVRQDTAGMGVRFVFVNAHQQHRFRDQLRGALARQAAASRAGNSLVEFALLLPVLFLLIVNAINFGGFFFAWITMASAARSAAQYAAMGGATVTSPTPPTATQVYNIVSADIASLPNRSSLAVRLCTNTNGTVACSTTGTGTFTNPPSDARTEASLFIMAWVDVLYTYQPLIPIFNFAGLGVNATLPATRIHRQAVMRLLQ